MAARNGLLSSAKAIASAERHRAIIELRKQGVEQAEIARRFDVSQQAVSKVLLRHVRNLPAEEAADLRRVQLESLSKQRELIFRALKNWPTTRETLRLLKQWERIDHHEARLLGLYDLPVHSIRISAIAESISPENIDFPPVAVNLEELRNIMKLDPSLALKVAEGPGQASATNQSDPSEKMGLPQAGGAIDPEEIRKLQESDPIIEPDDTK